MRAAVVRCEGYCIAHKRDWLSVETRILNRRAPGPSGGASTLDRSSQKSRRGTDRRV